MTRNQLPEGVGKKIVEALKRQNEADINPVENDNAVSNNIPLTDIQDLPDIAFDQPEKNSADTAENIIIEEDSLDGLLNSVEEEKPVENPEPAVAEAPVYNNMVNPVVTPIVNEMPSNTFMNQTFQTKEEVPQPVSLPNGQVNIPPNVSVLKNLISSLPVGVTKQTGAQIIRQTLEAMGLPMNSVLKEAQEVQEELNSSTRECMLKIQEYKTNILQLEQSVQEYQKNVTQINDLVSLFLLTDRK